MTDKSYDDIRAVLRTLENNNNQRVRANRLYRKENEKLLGEVAGLHGDAQKWRRLMELVDGNDTWDSASVLSHFSMDPNNETARRGVKVDYSIVRVGDVVDYWRRGRRLNSGVVVQQAEIRPSLSLEAKMVRWLDFGHLTKRAFEDGDEIRLVERNGVKMQPNMAQWEIDLLTEHAKPKPELPTQPGTIFRVLEFDGKPFEALAYVEREGDLVILDGTCWPGRKDWLDGNECDRITKFELVDVVTKESA